MSTQNIEQTLEAYAILKSKMKADKLVEAEMRETITAFVQDSGEDKYKTSLGTFSLTSRKTWEYPAYVTDAEDNYKVLKAKSESTGEATFVTKDSLSFRETKF